MGAPCGAVLSIVGVASPSFKVSCIPVIKCLTLPVLKRLDQDPREDPEEDNAVANGGAGDDEGRGQTGEVEALEWCRSLRRDKLK